MKMKQKSNSELLIIFLTSCFKVTALSVKILVRSLTEFFYLQIAVFVICAITDTEYFLSNSLNWFIVIGLVFYHYLIYKHILEYRLRSKGQ